MSSVPQVQDDPQHVVPREVADVLLSEIFGCPRSYAALAELCDRVGGRVAGTASGTAGEEWAAAHLRSTGLSDVVFQTFPVQAWTRGHLSASVTAPTPWPLTALAFGYSPRKVDLSAPVVDVGHGEREGFEGAGQTVRGALALCDEGATPGRRTLHRTEKMRLAVEHGAEGLMILSSAHGGLPRTGVGYSGEAPIPGLGISQEDGLRMRRLLRAGQQPIVRIAMSNTIAEGVARTVLADLPGRELPEEIVLAGAHLDSWDVAQGATDNGLGTAIVLEAARALAALPRRPRRTLRFALWGAEEIGLLGSEHYVNTLTPSVLLDTHIAIMNFDMTGDPYGYWIPGRASANPILDALADQLAPLGMTAERDTKAALHSDHQAFMLAGVPVIGLLANLRAEGSRYYHSIGDTFEKIDLGAMCRAAAVAAHTLWAIADAPERQFEALDAQAVRTMIDKAHLYDALVAGGFDGPPMRLPA